MGQNINLTVKILSNKFCLLLISNFRRVLNIVCILLGISPASDCCILHTSYPAYEYGTDRVFRNVGIQQSDAGEIPKRIHTGFKDLFAREFRD